MKNKWSLLMTGIISVMILVSCHAKQNDEIPLDISQSQDASFVNDISVTSTDDGTTNKDSWNTVVDAINNSGDIECDLLFPGRQIILGVYNKGEKIYVQDSDEIYQYIATEDRGSYSKRKVLSLNKDPLVLQVVFNDAGELIDSVYDFKADDYPIPTIVNTASDRYMLRMDSEDRTHYSYYTYDLSASELTKMSYRGKIADQIDVKSIRSEAYIALEDKKTLCHFEIREKKEEYSLWLVVDETGEVEKEFTSMPIDTIKRAMLNPSGSRICFLYGNTPGNPTIINIDEGIVTPIDGRYEGFAGSILAFNWVDEKTLAVSHATNNDEMISFFKVD